MLSVLGLGSHPMLCIFTHYFCSQLWWCGSFGAPLVSVLSTTTEYNNGVNLRYIWYLHLPFSSSKNYFRESFWVVRRSKLLVLLTFEDKVVGWLLLPVLWDKGRLEEELWKAAPPGEGGLYLLRYNKIREMLISPGTGISARCPKGGVVILYFLSLSCKILELCSS